MSHANAPLTAQGRLLLCQRIEAGSPIAHVASAMGISRRCASKWWHRYVELGADGLCDRSSRPLSSPRRTPVALEEQICRIRRSDKLGPDRLAGRLGLAPSTVHRVLVRHDLNRLSHLDRQSGREIRRYERQRPGELVHVDVKKLGKIPPGGGHKTEGARQPHRALFGGRGSASPMSIPPSTITPDWPTPRCWPTRPGPPARPFGAGPRPSSGLMASSSSGS